MNWKFIRIVDEYIGVPLMYLLRYVKNIFYPAFRPVVHHLPKRILLVKFWGIGNIFMMLPAVDSLRTLYPEAGLDVLSLETSRHAAGCIKVFDNIYTVDTRGVVGFLRTTLSTLSVLRQRDYDLVIDFEQFARFSALCVAVVSRKATIGFNTVSQHRHFLFSHPVLYDNNIHITDSYCSLVKSVVKDNPPSEKALCQAAGPVSQPSREGASGPVKTFIRSVQSVPPEGVDVLRRLDVRADRTVVVFHVGTSDNFKERRWPVQNYAALADLLIENCGVQIVLTGLAEESFIASDVISRMRCSDRVVDASGRLSFQEYFELIRLSALVISADTAAVHIASAVGTAVAGLYGPNTPLLYGPWGRSGLAFYKPPRCSPCITNFNAKTHVCMHREGKGACMKKIAPEEVYEEIRKRYFADSSVMKASEAETCPL